MPLSLSLCLAPFFPPPSFSAYSPHSPPFLTLPVSTSLRLLLLPLLLHMPTPLSYSVSLSMYLSACLSSLLLSSSLLSSHSLSLCFPPPISHSLFLPLHHLLFPTSVSLLCSPSSLPVCSPFLPIPDRSSDILTSDLFFKNLFPWRKHYLKWPLLPKLGDGLPKYWNPRLVSVFFSYLQLHCFSFTFFYLSNWEP